jgi:UMF1 family MFS transporter
MYDWANSVFSTTVAGVLLGPYVTSLAQDAVGENGPVWQVGSLTLITAKSLWPYTVSLSVFLQVFLLPFLGAVADYTALKKRLMTVFTYIAVVAVCLLFFVVPGTYLLGSLLFIIANVSFGGAIVMYNAYLSEITSEDRRDAVRVEFEALSTALLGAAEALARWWLRTEEISAGEAAELLISTIEPGLRARSGSPTANTPEKGTTTP